MNPRNSSAHNFYDLIMNSPDRLEFIRNLVDPTSPVFESEWLDFKGADNINDKILKEVWSKSLSAFANTEGGVLLWGIDARKDEESGIDAACDFSLCQNPANLKSRLLELHHTATDPPVAGVEIEHINDPSEGDKGFVVCLIPESNFKPHRTEYLKNKPYYIRAGDDFVIPSPSLLRQLFFPQSHSYLWVEVSAKWDASVTVGEWGDPVESGHVEFEVRIHNTGTSTAKELYIVIQSSNQHAYGISHEDWDTKNNPQGLLALEAKRPLHPGVVSELVNLSFNTGVIVREVNVDPRVIPNLEDIWFRFLMYGLDSKPQISIVNFDTKEIIRKAIKKGITEESI